MKNVTTQSRRAILGLALLLPAPTLGVLFGIVWWPGTAGGQVAFGLMKVWLLALPLYWWLRVERRVPPAPFTAATHRGWIEGLVSGLLIAGLILAAYVGIGTSLIDPVVVRGMLRDVGLGSPGRYLSAAAYWCLVNAWLEEYVWRWFVTRQFRVLGRPVWAVLLSASAFGIHHLVAMSLFMPFAAAVAATLGIVLGGVIWSGLYLRHGSLWPAYLSHVLADVAVFGIGYHLL